MTTPATPGALVKYVPRNLRDDGMVPLDEVPQYTHLQLQPYYLVADVERVFLAVVPMLEDYSKTIESIIPLSCNEQIIQLAFVRRDEVHALLATLKGRTA